MKTGHISLVRQQSEELLHEDRAHQFSETAV
jgi:hypothetical protein